VPGAGPTTTPLAGAAPDTPGPTPSARPVARTVVGLRFAATRDQVCKAFPAIANLADKADGAKVVIQVQATIDLCAVKGLRRAMPMMGA